MSNQIIFVQARTGARGGPAEFTPYRVEVFCGLLARYPLVRVNPDGEARSFATLQEAEAVTRRYEHGSDEECRSAHWDDSTGEWVGEEYRHCAWRGDREDFHADG